MTDHNAEQFVLWPVSVQYNAEPDHDEWQPRCLEGQKTNEAQYGIGMPTAPDVNQGATQSRAKKSLVKEGCQAEQRCGGICHHPGKGGWGGGRLFEHTGVALDEEDMEEELKAEGTEIYECRQESPVLH